MTLYCTTSPVSGDKHTHIHTYACTHTYAHTHMHTHTATHTQTYMHTNTMDKAILRKLVLEQLASGLRSTLYVVTNVPLA